MILDPAPANVPTTRREAVELLGVWASTLGVAAVGLLLAMMELQPPPRSGSTQAWSDWASQHDPSDAVAATVAPFALVVVGVLGVALGVAALFVASATRRGRRVSCSDRWPAAATSFVAAVALLAGGSAGASTGSGASAGGDVAGRPVVALVEGVDPVVTAPTTSAPATTAPPTTVPSTTAPLTTAPAPAPTTVATTSPPTPTAPPEPSPSAAAPSSTDHPEGPGSTVVVQPGDSLWRIAERQVAARPENGPTVRYWLRLIDLNRSRFVEPGNPNLILPGQVLDLPTGQ